MNWRTLFGRGLRPQTTSPDGTTGVDPEVAAWLAAAFDATSWDEGRERDALERLRSRGTDGVEAVSRAYWSASQDSALRWAMVRCACDLGTEEAHAFLAELVESELPPETSRDVHHFSSVAEESSQRMQAVRGLASAAARGNARALNALAAALDHPITAVRHAAFTAVRDLPPDVRAASDELAAGLARDEREFGAMTVADVADHALPDERFEERFDWPEPPSEGDTARPLSTRRAPQVGDRAQEGDSHG